MSEAWICGTLGDWVSGQRANVAKTVLTTLIFMLKVSGSKAPGQDRARQVQVYQSGLAAFSTLALLLYAQTFLTCRRSNQDVDDAKKWRLQVEPNDNCCELNRCLKVYYGVQTCYRFVLIQHVLYTARIRNDIILIHCQYNMREVNPHSSQCGYREFTRDLC